MAREVQSGWCGVSADYKEVDVYPVGLLWDLRHLGRSDVRFVVRLIRKRHWRCLRNYFNGYLAEHPTAGTRAGHRWTRSRALRDLELHLSGARK